MNDPSRVAVVGATGYAGFELARLLLRHPQIEKPTFYLARRPCERPLPDGALPAAARMGRSAVQAALRRGHREERRGGRVSFHASRSFARTRARAARGESRAAHRGFERRVSLPRAGNVRAVVQAGRAGRRNAWRSRVWLAGALRRRAARGARSWPIRAAIRRR